MPRGDNCWKNWGEDLRVRMMRQKVASVTLPVEQIYQEVGTGEPFANLQKYSFWNSCRNHIPYWDTLHKAGIEVDFEINARGEVDEVTFSLNETWRWLMEGR
jgi:hypothetical protein